MENRILDYEPPRGATAGPARAPEGPFDPTARDTDWKESLQDYIAANPGISLGAALLVGVLLGWFIKRR